MLLAEVATNKAAVATIETVVTWLVGLVIMVSSGLIVWLLKQGVESFKAREEKIDMILSELQKKVTNLEQHKAVSDYAEPIKEARLFRLEQRVDKHEERINNLTR